MRKNIIAGLVICCLFTACIKVTPEKYFDRAVLNTNTLAGFADEGQLRQLTYPSLKADANGLPVALKSKDVLDQKIKFLQKDFDNLKQLQLTPGTKIMLTTSIALYQYVLPVYRTEYAQLAKMYDNGANEEAVASQAKLIHDKYKTGFDEVLHKLIQEGKIYARLNNITVNWDVQTSPKQ